NLVDAKSILPDSIIKARNGKTVEIINTDAEGRLVLADLLDYACDQKPDAIIDIATLTGGVVIALGIEMAAVMGNNQDLIEKIRKAATAVNEYVWPLPIIPEYGEDMKSPVADWRNSAATPNAQSSKAAFFLQNFIKNDIPWAHLDIAGIAHGQAHLPYCPPKGPSGLIIRTLVELLFTYA
ncbi:MAG: aminopeptidase, partial [Pseudomonadota bacterium]